MMKNLSRLRINRVFGAITFGRGAGALLAGLCVVLTTASGAQAADFPLKASANGRYLVDQQGKPYLLVGASPWTLIVQLDQADQTLYLNDRQAKGFNALIVQLLVHKGASNAPDTLAGLAPFTTPGDFSTPNDAYFNYAHQVIKEANDHGMVVFLAPDWLGYEGGDQGWYHDMLQNGPQKVHDFGVYVGNKFKDLNIAWVVGGDYVPPAADQWTVTSVAQGIHEADPTHLITVHNSRGISSSEIYGDQPWLTVDGAYLGDGAALIDPVYESYNRHPTRPIVLLEDYYERRTSHVNGPWDIRRQAYDAMLAGARGQFFGNESIYPFGDPDSGDPTSTWQQQLNSTGSRDMTRLHNFFKSLPWYQLVPDPDHALVTGGYGTGASTIIDAFTADKTWAVIYIPSLGTQVREFTVDLSQLAGPITAQWYDPTNGIYTSANGGPLSNLGQYTFDTPGANSGGAGDWVLLMSVPEPGSLALLGLGGLIMLKRRRCRV